MADRLRMPEFMRKAVRVKRDEPFDVFPENWLSVGVFLSMQTQWVVAAGMGGAVYTGLRYESLDRRIQLAGAPAEDHDDVYRDILEMERAYLGAMAEKR